ncbi:MAG: hypothetical protein HRT89_24920, partial [Lentisphaeria bacterium]|nr:hypothetical protein [Lentisphaeria bacterium]
GSENKVDYSLLANDAIIKADQQNFYNIFLNLAQNSREAFGDAGTVMISTHNIRIDMDIEIPFGDYVELRFTDTGSGIPKERQKDVIQPFYTTKVKKGSNGLGLSIIHSIISQWGGYIRIGDNKSEQGTTISILFKQERDTFELITGTQKFRTESILIIEKNNTIRQLCSDVLQQQGFHVFATNREAHGVRLIKEHTDKIHLVIYGKDILGLDISGDYLQRIKILHMLPVTETMSSDHQVINTPFTPTVLVATVKSLLQIT